MSSTGRRLAGLAALILLAGAPPAMAQEDPAARVQRIEGLVAGDPDPFLLWFLAEARFVAGDADGAASALSALADRQAGYAPPRRSAFGGRLDHEGLRRVMERMRREATVTGGQVTHTLEMAGGVPEGLAHDARTGRLFVGDMAERRLFALSSDGEATVFAENLDLRPLGLMADVEARLLWVATTDAFWDDPAPRSALLAFDLDSGRQVLSIDASETLSLNDMTRTPTGDLYVSDTAGGAVFILRPGATELARVTPADGLIYPNGLAASGDGRFVYIAQGRGLKRLETATGVVTDLRTPASLSLPYVDGLYWHEGDLVAVQSVGMDRVVRIRLNEAGDAAEGFEVLAAVGGLDTPTTGAIADDSFYVLANAQIDKLRGDGTIAGPMDPVRILRLSLAD